MTDSSFSDNDSRPPRCRPQRAGNRRERRLGATCHAPDGDAHETAHQECDTTTRATTPAVHAAYCRLVLSVALVVVWAVVL